MERAAPLTAMEGFGYERSKDEKPGSREDLGQACSPGVERPVLIRRGEAIASTGTPSPSRCSAPVPATSERVAVFENVKCLRDFVRRGKKHPFVLSEAGRRRRVEDIIEPERRAFELVSQRVLHVMYSFC